MKMCKIMRGVPGCGKSYLSRLLYPNASRVSTDDYFMVNGEYRFNPTKLSECHNKALLRFVDFVASGIDKVVVDNTNIRMFEISPYYRLAEAFGYDVEIIHVVRDLEACKLANTHGVPDVVIDNMMKSIEPIPPWWNQRSFINNNQG